MKKLPIGIQTFREIVTENYYYVDKTKLIPNLLNGKYYFLARPRRFGKSLFLDTLREAFLGHKEYFQGLHLETHWDWSKAYPVIRIDFGSGVMKEISILEKATHEILTEHSEKEKILLTNETISGRFRELILNLEKKYSQKVVILIDEYDKPILDNITNPKLAIQMRDSLRNLYSTIKSADAYIKFVFFTGVSKFSKVNLFSGVNNLQDISLDERYATLCGYTEQELIQVFHDRLHEVSLPDIRKWYNGYNFLGEKVYNPFDVLLFLDRKQFKNYWFETGSPSFLLDLIREKKYNVVQLENLFISEDELNAFDIENIQLETLLFQTGYLTILEKLQVGSEVQFKLGYPNEEVKRSLTSVILKSLSESPRNAHTKQELFEALTNGQVTKLKDIFYTFFASIPHDWYRKNLLSNYEGYYASIFYCYFTALGLDVRVEDVTNHGQVDMTVFINEFVYVFEFKVVELTNLGSALEQIQKNKYYEKYLPNLNNNKIKQIYLVGVEFSKETRNILNFEYSQIQ